MQTPKFDAFNDRVKKYFNRKKQSIEEVVREATAGGIVFRRNKSGEVEILLIQDPKGRWSIPKGHVEEGETAQETAIREIGEEAGLTNVEAICWLGKTHFRYRRLNTLVLMTTQIYLVKALGNTEKIKKEDFYANIKWFSFADALEAVEYEDISKLMLLAMKRIRHAGN
ncbi:MAG: NUDIX domain-containing protein [Candidatus Saccharimonadales bacterium]